VGGYYNHAYEFEKAKPAKKRLRTDYDYVFNKETWQDRLARKTIDPIKGDGKLAEKFVKRFDGESDVKYTKRKNQVQKRDRHHQTYTKDRIQDELRLPRFRFRQRNRRRTKWTWKRSLQGIVEESEHENEVLERDIDLDTMIVLGLPESAAGDVDVFPLADDSSDTDSCSTDTNSSKSDRGDVDYDGNDGDDERHGLRQPADVTAAGESGVMPTTQRRLRWNSVLDLPASLPTGVPAPTILRQPRFTVGTIPVNRETIANEQLFDDGDNERATSQHRLQWNSVLDLPASHPTGVPAPTILRQPRYTVGTIPVNREAIVNEQLFDDGDNERATSQHRLQWNSVLDLPASHPTGVPAPTILRQSRYTVGAIPVNRETIANEQLFDDGDGDDGDGDSNGDYSDNADEQALTSSNLEEPVVVISKDSSAAQTRVPYYVPSDGLGSMWIFDLAYPEHATVRRSCRTAGRYRPGMYKV
jgi:hypothetical protein